MRQEDESGAMYRRNYVAIYLHLVWGTWDREPLLHGEVERLIYRAIGEKCSDLRARMVALGGVEDHVHLLVMLPSTLTVATLVGQVKGASAHLANHTEPAQSAELFKWQGTYGAFSLGQQQVPHVVEYIRRQREHHALGTLRSEWEEVSREDGEDDSAPGEAAPGINR